MKLAYPVATPEVRSKILGFSGPIEEVCRKLRGAGYEAIEPFICNPAGFDGTAWARSVAISGMEVAAVGTGPLVFDDRLSFTDKNEEVRAEAIARVKAVIEFAARFGAQVNIGKLRGDLPAGGETQAKEWQRQAFIEICGAAAAKGLMVTLEPQNRKIVNNLNTTPEALAWLRSMALPNLRLMLDVFHMHEEQEDIPANLASANGLIHMHYADTDRLILGSGRLDFPSITAALGQQRDVRFITIEIKQDPDSDTAARRSADFLLPLLKPA